MKIYNQNAKKYFVILVLCSLLTVVMVPTLHAYAASSPLNKTVKQTEIFPVPEGGWSSIDVEVSYSEHFKENTSGSNKFYQRDKIVVFNRSYATSAPVCKLYNVVHSNNATFSKWQSMSVLFGSGWQGAEGYKNTEEKSYLKNTDITGKLAFVIECKDSLVPSRAGAVDLSLKTN